MHYGDEASLTIETRPAAAPPSPSRLPGDHADEAARASGVGGVTMTKIRVVIADDERPARSFLRRLRSFPGRRRRRRGGVRQRGGGAHREHRSRSRPARPADARGRRPRRRALLRKDRMPLVAFVTAYDQYAVRAFELNAVDYLLKPVDRARLRETLNRAQERMERPEEGARTPEPRRRRLRAAAAAYEAVARPRTPRSDPVRRRDELTFSRSTRSPRSWRKESCFTSCRGRRGTRSPTG